MNREVENNGLAMTATGIPFEIRVNGTNVGALSHIQSGQGELATYTDQEIYGSAPNNSYLKGLSNGLLVQGNTYETDNTNNKIKWRLNQAYDAAEDKGFGPDSQGILSFSVVPKQNGELNPSFSLRLEGYVAPGQKNNYNGSYQVLDNSIVPINDESTDEQKKAANHLNSHILFFKNRRNVGTEQNPKYEYSGLLDKNDIKLANIVDSSLLTNGKLIVSANNPIDATIYWIWPNTFGQMVFDSNSQIPVGETPEARSEIQNYILDNVLSVFDESVFGFEEGTSESDKIAEIKGMMTTSSGTGDNITYTFSAERVHTGSNFDVLTLGYNNADQKIGTQVNYMLLALSYEQ